MGQAISFNRISIGQFFSNLKTILENFPLTTSDTYNWDETSMATVHVPPKVFREMGQKIVGKAASSERGVLVTMVGTVSVSGKFSIPYFIFPRKNSQPYLLTGGLGNSAG